MNYSDFVYTIEAMVKERVGENVKVEIHKNLKNNGKERIGLVIKEAEINIAPAIYLEEFYDRWSITDDLEGIICEILSIQKEVKLEKSFDSNFLKDYQLVKEKLAFKVVHYEKNKDLLRDVPHIKFLDLAIVFYVLVDENEKGIATMVVKNSHKNNWKVELSELYDDAIKNAEVMLPSDFQPMTSIISELLVEEQDIEKEKEKEKEEAMFVLSNRNRNLGAACILYEGVLEKIAKYLREDYYVIPSSIHEVIIVPFSKSPEKAELEEMIREINETQLEEEEVLSNYAYFYSVREQRLLY